MSLRQLGRSLLNGLLMGSADVVPGVSGGTVALALGIYERLIATISDLAGVLAALLRADFRGLTRRISAIDWLFLIPLLAGVASAVVTLASLIEALLRDHPEALAGLFCGLVLASAVIARRLMRAARLVHLIVACCLAVGVFLVMGLQAGPVADPSWAALFGAGMVAICAMILPGISGSFLLLMMGMYGTMIAVIHERRFGDAAVFVAGAAVGLAWFSTVLNWFLMRLHDWLLAMLIGLMLGSLRVLWPWPDGVGVIDSRADRVVRGTGLEWPGSDEWLWPSLLAVVAFTAVLMLHRRTHNPAAHDAAEPS